MLQRFRAGERDVAGEDQNFPAASFPENRRRLQDGVPRAELFLLHGVAGTVAQPLLHRLTLMADDDDGQLVGNLRGQIDDVVDDRPSRSAMQHLDRRRFHPGAEAGGKDDDFEVVAHCSFRIRSRVRP